MGVLQYLVFDLGLVELRLYPLAVLTRNILVSNTSTPLCTRNVMLEHCIPTLIQPLPRK